MSVDVDIYVYLAREVRNKKRWATAACNIFSWKPTPKGKIKIDPTFSLFGFLR